MSGTDKEENKVASKEEGGVRDQGIPLASQDINREAPRERYWSIGFSVLNAILVVLAGAAAYLEYSVYPTIMTQSFGETGPSLHLSILTFQWDATRCQQVCSSIPGVLALDFFQVFVIALVLVNLSHYLRLRRT
jgi:hypothetical protein